MVSEQCHVRARLGCLIDRIDKTIHGWRSVRSTVTPDCLMELPRKYSKGEKIVLKESWQALDRVTAEIDAIGRESQFGVEKIIGAEEAKYDNGKKQSTSVLVPTDEQTVTQYLLPLYVEFRKQTPDVAPGSGEGEGEGQNNEQTDRQTNEDPNTSTNAVVQNVVVEQHVKVLLAVETEGKSLTKCSSSWELCESIAHCLLGGFHAFELEA